ncbi:MAG: hypothetical protein ABI317_14955 [Gaiellales bacterium]
MRTLRVPLLAACLCASAILPASAVAATHWTQISSALQANSTVPQIGVQGSTAVVTWEQDTSPSTQDIVSDTFQTSPTATVANGHPGKVAEGWTTLGTQAIIPTTAGGLQIAFSGTHSTSNADPLIGLIGETHNADGSWTAPAVIAYGEGAAASTGVLSGATPIYANNATGAIYVLTNPTSAASIASANLMTEVGGTGDGYSPTLALDSSGRLWAAWYVSGTDNGIRVQQLDQTTGLPIGTPVTVPSSDDIENNTSAGVALTCAASCRVVYGIEPSGSSTDVIASWWIGESAPTTLVNLAGTGQNAGAVLAARYRSDGKLWVVWWNGKTYSYELGDAKGSGGAVQDAGVPGPLGGAYGLEIAPVGDNLLMAVDFNYVSGQGTFGIFVNTVAPPAPVAFAPGPRQSTVESTPGGKGFRIQVQYKVPSICKPRCVAHAELRTRNGRQLYAVSATAPLPGDGKVVLGTRGSVKLPGGKKVRFYLTISKAELLKAPFSTVGGNRVANTRLRVWLTTKGGQQLTVRDGRIAVSIARIKSGALPGLAGIL